ncbi:MAG: amino acid racemase [Sphaerochaetaceae bacterium]|nr:amino acid racemase [Sphaerochaetaceae bacterium]
MMNKTIGILGGVGPAAGIDLAGKILKHTKADRDQEHINTIMVSCPSLVPDRTAYLLQNGENPASGIEKCANILARSGASVFGICCNTAHSPKILGQVNFPEGLRFINMIDSTCRFISETFTKGKIGLLSTLGTMRTEIYDRYIENYPELELVKPDETTAEAVHDAIYNHTYGIKAVSPVSEDAYKAVSSAVRSLSEKGCVAVILGCTELPLVFPGKSEFEGTALIDPTDVLAVELIKATEPAKLK